MMRNEIEEMTFTQLPVDGKRAYVEILRAGDDFGFTFSKSGKAVLFPRPKHTGDFWVPCSLVRRANDHQSASYGEAILVPTWFLQQERIVY